MPLLRIATASFLVLLSGLLSVVTLAALHPRIDVTRMVLAGNGSILRGFVVAAVAGWAIAWLTGRLLARRMPRLAMTSRALGVITVVASVANIATWMVGMEQRAVEFQSDGATARGRHRARIRTAGPGLLRGVGPASGA